MFTDSRRTPSEYLTQVYALGVDLGKFFYVDDAFHLDQG